MTLVRHPYLPVARRPRRGFTPEALPLEGRQLLTATPMATATMTQTATFPDIESYPTLSDQGLLYFGATMGTLTEVDLVTSGSFRTTFAAENLASTGGAITGTTTANLAIDVPTGSVPVAIPSVAQTFNASAYDGQPDDGGTSGRTFAPVTSSSTPQTTVLTSPADLAAFTGHFRIPISVSGHATGSAASGTGDVSTAFQTDTSATITVIYHYIPDLPSLDPPPASPSPASPSPSAGSGTGAVPISSQATVAGSNAVSAPSVQPAISSAHAGQHAAAIRAASHHRPSPRQLDLARHRPTQFALTAHHHATAGV